MVDIAVSLCIAVLIFGLLWLFRDFARLEASVKDLERRVSTISNMVTDNTARLEREMNDVKEMLRIMLERPGGAGGGGRHRCGFDVVDYALWKAKIELLWHKVRNIEKTLKNNPHD